ncbi:CU044_5270 family protein [Actinospica robiniae]|uniref:CU044_5270 family protein n=1 Tax=Actinospica robiniae TaxID=304901 RepID=UPI0003F4EEA6|nr:CU044_5270 family protein [Actinospica robiniae]
MSEIDVVRELRAESGLSGPERLAAGRARLSAAIAEEAGRSVRRTAGRQRLFLKVGVGLLATAAVAAVLAEPAKAPPAPPVHEASKGPDTPPMQEAAAVQLLEAASVTVAAHTGREPGNHQWIYSRSVDAEQGQPTVTDDEWITFDGSQSAYLVDGKLTLHTSPALPPGSDTSPLGLYEQNTTLETAYNALASLPSDPEAILADIRPWLTKLGPDTAELDGSGSATAKEHIEEFDYLSQLIWNAYAAAPGSALAAVFKTMAAIPGITVEQGVKDVVGRPSVGVSNNGGTDELLLDPTTYQVVGMRVLSQVPKGDANGPDEATVRESLAWTQVTMVSEPGRK